MSFRARFIDPMLLQLTPRLPEGAQWLYELKLDGYRAIAFKSGGKVRLRSRNDNDFAGRYSSIAGFTFGSFSSSVRSIESNDANDFVDGNPGSHLLGALSRGMSFLLSESMFWGMRDPRKSQ